MQTMKNDEMDEINRLFYTFFSILRFVSTIESRSHDHSCRKFLPNTNMDLNARRGY